MIVSVILPTYNRKEQVIKSIESVLNQSYEDLELIVVDDGSCDGTYDLLLKITDARFKVYHLETNMGACAARNYGINVAHGELITFQDSDDLWHKDYLDKMVSELVRMDTDVIFCKLFRHSLDGKNRVFPNFSSGYISQERLISHPRISTQTIMGKKKCFEVVRFDEDMPRLQDYDLIIRLSEKYKLYHLDLVLADVYVQKDSLSLNPYRLEAALRLILAKYPTLWNRYPRIKAKHLDVLAGTVKRLGRNSLVYYRLSFQASPSLLRAIKLFYVWIYGRLVLSNVDDKNEGIQ